MSYLREPAVWFPAMRAGTGADVFTERLAQGLKKRGFRAEITWLPPRAEYAPWTVPVPAPPAWANVAHINTWLHPRFLPKHLPIIATIHHAVHHADARAYKGWARAAYHRLWIAPNERRVLRRADRVVAVSRFVAEVARSTLLDVPLEVIYNGVDTDRFRPGSRQRNPDEPFRLLYVGSWMARKGVDLLAPIMRELGDGFELRYTGGAITEREKPGVASNMHDIGWLQGDDAVVAAMQDVDALLFPSRSEGFGLVAVEAMACGLPVICTRGSSLVEIVEDARTGILCEIDNIVAFVEAIRRIATDTKLRARYSYAASNHANERFAESLSFQAYVALYQRCIAGTKSDDLLSGNSASH